MTKKVLGMFALVLIALAIVLPNTACRRVQDNAWIMTGIPEVDSTAGLEVAL